MITEISYTPEQSYSCQFCQKVVSTTETYRIDAYFAPCCSRKCFFNVLYRFLKKQTLSYNLLLLSCFLPYTFLFSDVKSPESQENELIFDNAKLLTKHYLSSIKGGLSLYHQLIIIS